MSQIFTIITTAFAAREYRAADIVSDMEDKFTPPEQFNFNDIRALGANNHKARYSPTEGL